MENDNSHAPRLILFVLLSSLVLFAYPALMQRFAPKPPAVAQKQDADPAKGDEPAEKKADGKSPAGDTAKVEKKADGDKPAEPAAAVKPAKAEPEQWATLGSADPKSGYRMLVTLTNRGAAVERIELNHPRYTDITHRETLPQEDQSGWIGHIAPITSEQPAGCRVQVVGRATPVEKAGIKSGDVITAINGEAIVDDIQYRQQLFLTRPGKPLELTINRAGKEEKLSVTPIARPVRIVQAESADPLSFLLTLDALDDRKIDEGRDELKGLTLRTGNWQTKATDDEVTFTWPLVESGLEIVKRYRLVKAPDDQIENLDHDSFHVEMSVELRNTGKAPVALAYRLDGPTGLPIEGSWYAQKISRTWSGGVGMRDPVARFQIQADKFTYPEEVMVTCDTVAAEGSKAFKDDPKSPPVLFAGVDSLYFAAALHPVQEDVNEHRFSSTTAIRVGLAKPGPDRKLTNVSTRLVSQLINLDPGSEVKHDYRIFAGPKRPKLLAKYGMGELIYYGWPIFSWTAKPLLWLMHFFHDYVVFNYGLAIVMLTVTVRSCMFPISRKQALNAAKMQELQPELKKITEKYKGDMEKRAKAQQELFAKHKYHPLSGCLPVFLQLPIFIGLYRSLSLDIELRHSPLIPGVEWCGNLCAPDMLWYWEPRLIAWLSGPQGWLGPYMNVLPLMTVGLFLYQQKKMMPAPDPNDEQAVMQHKVMTYMMIFMGLMFFKVASGLCIYFIASSLWSLAERKLLPKPAPKGGDSNVIDVTPTSSNGSDRKKNRDRR
jgi:YidC/Oxa1 family membrane protein insertase